VTELPFSNARIAPLMEEGAFELPENPPLVTDDGRPWVRWANVGAWSGWYTLGTRRYHPMEHPDGIEGFWELVCLLASEVGNGRSDACHCIGPGVLSVGGLGVTVASGFGVALLARCLCEAPLHWVSSVAPAVHATGTYLRVSDEGLDSVLLENVEHGTVRDRIGYEGAIRGGSPGNRWSGSQKRKARVWVESVSRALAHPSSDRAAAQFCRDHLPKILGPIAGLAQWPVNGIQDAWMWSIEQRALWALAMVLVIEDELQALRAMRSCIQWEPEDAKASLRNLRSLAERDDTEHTPTFRKRVGHTVDRVQDVFKFKLGDA
jgi:hypothetical protein